jgi:outer membrane receptor protein involved in Fe transport
MGQHEVASSLNEVSTPGFTVFDLRGYWQATPNLLLISGVETLGDKLYREHLDPLFGNVLFRPGANFYFTVQVSY